MSSARRRRRLRTRITAALIHGVLSLGAVFMLLPMVWMLATSFKLPGEIAVWPPHLFPNEPTLSNYSGLFEAAPFVRFFGNSVFISVASTISCVVTSMVAGAVFAKYRFPGRTALFMLVLATAIVPFEAYMIPLYIELVQIHWINTYQAIILPTLVMSFGIFLVRQHVASAIPDELMEAARVDGASECVDVPARAGAAVRQRDQRGRDLRIHPGLGCIHLAIAGGQQSVVVQYGARAQRVPVPFQH